MSLESLHKAEVFAESYNEYQIRSFPLSSMEKEKMSQLEMLRLKFKEIKARVGCLLY